MPVMDQSCHLDLGAQSWPVVQAVAAAPEDVTWAPWKVDSENKQVICEEQQLLRYALC